MKYSIAIITATALLSAGGIAIGQAKDKKPAPEVRNIGEPVSCVNIRQIRSTRIIDDKTIDFEMAGGKIFRNSMEHSCPSLKSEDRFSYRTSLNQLCNVDIIYVLHDYGGRLQEGAGCGLGKFQQIEFVKDGAEKAE